MDMDFESGVAPEGEDVDTSELDVVRILPPSKAAPKAVSSTDDLMRIFGM